MTIGFLVALGLMFGAKDSIARSHCLDDGQFPRLVDSVKAGYWQASWRLQSYWLLCKMDKDSAKKWWNTSDSLGYYFVRYQRLVGALKQSNVDCERILWEAKGMKCQRCDYDFRFSVDVLRRRFSSRCGSRFDEAADSMTLFSLLQDRRRKMISQGLLSKDSSMCMCSSH